MSILRLLTVIALCLLYAHTVYANDDVFFPDQKTGNKHYKNQDYKTALKHWQPLADQGYSDAQVSIGRLYSRGLGVQKDHSLALNYFRKAAAQNNAKAQFEIANAYQKGYDVEKDISTAEKWYLISAGNGYLRAYGRIKDINPDFVIPSKENNLEKKYRFKTSLRTQFITEDNLDLGISSNTETAIILDGKLTGHYQINKNIHALSQVRAVESSGNALSNNDDEDNNRDASFAEIRQGWIEFKNLFNKPILSAKMGRQRFREDRANWWNRDLDALRLNINSSLTTGFFAVGQNFSKYRIGTDNNLEEDEKQRLRLLGELSHQYKKGHFIETRFLYENDHSDEEQLGQRVLTNDRDDSDYNLLWAGLRIKGNLNESAIRYRSDVLGVVGKERVISTQVGPSADLRTVNNIQNRDVFGWAFDGSLEIPIPFKLEPTLTISYAYGSGDDGTGNNNGFRQTGLEGNTSYYPENTTSGALRNYGEVLRPELSNIHILNTGLNLPVLKTSDLNLNYYSYWRANSNTGIPNNGINATLSQNGNHIGQALDFVANINIHDELNLEYPLIEKSTLRIKAGSFLSGNAYGSSKNEAAYKGTLELGLYF